MFRRTVVTSLVSRHNNPLRCFATISGQQPVGTVDWTAKTRDVYSFIEDVTSDKIARNALKDELLSTVVRRIVHLNREPAPGGNTTCFVGERGGGKSHTLMLLVEAAAKKLPNVVPVYIDYSGYTDVSKPLPLPSALIEEVLGLRGVSLDRDIDDMKDVQHVFRKLNLRLLVVLDEFEQVYQKGGEASAARVRSFSKLLQELNDIGNSHTGESWSLPLLITARKEASLEKRFPMLEYAIDLNSTKYPQRHLPSIWVKSEDEFVAMVQALHPSQSGVELRKSARALAVVYGCNLRTLRNYRFDSKLGLKFEWGVRADDAKEAYRHVIEPLDDALRTANKDLLQALRAALYSNDFDGSIDAIDVFNKMVGLSKDQVMAVLKDVKHWRTVDLLCELSWYSGSIHGHHSKLYPNSVLSLLVEGDPHVTDNALRFIQLRLGKFLNEAAENGAKASAPHSVKNTLSEALPELRKFLFGV